MAERTFKLDFPETLTRAVKVSGGALPKDFNAIVPLSIDFRGCSGQELGTWAMSDRVIAWQRPARSMAPEFLKNLSKEGLSVHARTCGAQMKSPEERIAELVAIGINPELAALIIADPAKAQAVQAQLLNK